MPSAVPPDQCHVRPRVVFLSPRSPFTLNHPVVFHSRCHFTSPLIVSSVSFSTPPSVSVLPRSDEETSLACFSPHFGTLGNRITLLLQQGFFSPSVKWMCVLSSLFCLLGQENSSNVGRFCASRFFKVKFMFKFLNDFIFQQSCTKKVHFGGFLLSVKANSERSGNSWGLEAAAWSHVGC